MRGFVRRAEADPGPLGFLARRIRTLIVVSDVLRFVVFYFTVARRVRQRHAEAQRTGGTIWLDEGPFA